MRDLYREVTDKIIAELETGAAPWVKPWRSLPQQGQPHNAATGRPYSGVNILLLWIASQTNGWSSSGFLTFKQAKELGGTVRGGEKGTHIVFVKKLLVKERDPKPDEDDTKQITMLRDYTVFNIAQCDGLPERITNPVARPPRHTDDRDPLIDEFITATQTDVREGAGEAFYAPGPDFISMPAFEAFNSADHYYGTLLHELTHWTGHKSRCNRDDLIDRFHGNKEARAAEELIAELGSAFLAAEFGLDGELRHADYIGSWLQLLKNDKKAIFAAATRAQAAADYLRGLALSEAVDDDDNQLAA